MMDSETKRAINVLHTALKGLGQEMIDNSKRIESEFKAIGQEFEEQAQTRDSQYKLLWEYIDGVQGKVDSLEVRIGHV